MDAINDEGSPISRFESAVDAIVAGDAAALEALLHEHPELIRARSAREHGAPLLHYVAANAVEDFRQKTPKFLNWLGVTPLHQFARKDDLEMAALFIEHGADLNARDDDSCSTPLAWAAKFGRTRMVDFLLRRGAFPAQGKSAQPWGAGKFVGKPAQRAAACSPGQVRAALEKPASLLASPRSGRQHILSRGN